MKINFTKKQYRLLLDLVYIGRFVINGIRTSDQILEEYEEIQQYVYSFAKKMGCGDLVEYNRESNMFYETNEFDKMVMERYIEEYDAEVLWKELATGLEERDVMKCSTGKDEIKPEELIMKIWAREEEYNEEFYENGLDNVKVDMK